MDEEANESPLKIIVDYHFTPRLNEEHKNPYRNKLRASSFPYVFYEILSYLFNMYTILK